MEPRLLMSGEPTVGDMFASATPINLPADGTVFQDGTLADSEQTALYRFTAPARGRVSVELEALGGDVDPLLQVYNAAERLIGRNDNAGGETLDSFLRRFVRAGQTYYILAAANEGTSGDYRLLVTSDPVDDYDGALAAASALRTRRSGAGAYGGRIQYAGDEDTRSFVATTTGLARVQMFFRGRNNVLEGTLSAYDADGTLLGTVSRSGGESAVALNFSVTEGQTYYLRAAGANNSQGRYIVRMDSILAQEFVDAEEVVVLGEDQVVRTGTIAPDGRYTYKFTAAADGYFHLDMTAADGSGIDPYLEVFSTRQRLVAKNDDLNSHVSDSQVRLRVRAGQTYYVRASAAEGTSGDYELTFTGAPRDDYANDPAMAAAVRVRRDGAAVARGIVHYSDDVDYLEYTAPISGRVTILLSAYGRNNTLAAGLSVLDSNGATLAAQQAAAGGGLSLSFTATAGENYSLAVTGEAGSTGRYMLRVLPTIWQEFIDATPVDVPAWGVETVSGTLGADGSTCYRFTAGADGYMLIDMAAANGSGLDSKVEVFSAAQRRIAANDDYGSRDDSRVRLRVRAGQTYYVRASAVEGTSGDYDLTFTAQPIDDAGNDLAHAAPRRLTGSGAGAMAGKIQYDSDVDVLRVVAPVTGEMTVTMAAHPDDTSLTPKLAAADADGTQLAVDEDGDATTTVTFDVTAGGVYYLLASDLADGTGRYSLAVQTTPVVVPDPDPAPAPDPDPQPDPAPAPDAPGPQQAVTGWSEDYAGGTRLVIAGTDGDDTITLSYSGTTATLVSAAGTVQFTGSFSGVWIYGFAGDDVLHTDWSVSFAVTIYAGDGADTVYENARGSATVYGGAGDDLLVTVGGGADELWGESGTDSFWLDGSDVLRDASSAETTARNVHRIQQFYQPYTTNPASSGYVSMEVKGQDLLDPTPTSYAHGWANFADRPLFADGAEYDDIVQGYVGDCYYLASLASLAETDQNLIHQMITALGDGTYAVRFYRNGEEVYLRLDADLPVISGTALAYARLSPDGETWVALAEKAYAYFRYGQNTYQSISGGWMSTVNREITNIASNTVWVGGSAATLATTIANALSAGHAVTLGSTSTSPSPIVGSHAYVVMAIEGSGADATVTVYNPWGVDGRSYDSNYYDGLLRLNMTQLQECFTAMVVSNA